LPPLLDRGIQLILSYGEPASIHKPKKELIER
jgi:hypothetical protein